MGIARALVVVGLALVLSACGLKEAYDNSGAAVATFHRGLDQEKYQAIWAGSSAAMKQSGTLAEFTKFLTVVHTKMGKVKSTKQIDLNVNSVNSTTTVQAVMETEFEKGKAQETFIFLQEGERLILQSYNINSPTLVTG